MFEWNKANYLGHTGTQVCPKYSTWPPDVAVHYMYMYPLRKGGREVLANLIGVVMVSLNATLGLPVIEGQLYSVFKR